MIMNKVLSLNSRSINLIVFFQEKRLGLALLSEAETP